MFLRTHKSGNAETLSFTRHLGSVFVQPLCVGVMFNGQGRIGFEIRRAGKLIFQYAFFIFKLTNIKHNLIDLKS